MGLEEERCGLWLPILFQKAPTPKPQVSPTAPESPPKPPERALVLTVGFFVSPGPSETEKRWLTRFQVAPSMCVCVDCECLGSQTDSWASAFCKHIWAASNIYISATRLGCELSTKKNRFSVFRAQKGACTLFVAHRSTFPILGM